MPNNLNKQINTRINQKISRLIDDSDTVVRANTANNQKLPEKKQRKLNVYPAHVRTARIDRVACPLLLYWK